MDPIELESDGDFSWCPLKFDLELLGLICWGFQTVESSRLAPREMSATTTDVNDPERDGGPVTPLLAVRGGNPEAVADPDRTTDGVELADVAGSERTVELLN
jgi:hypothetical protein